MDKMRRNQPRLTPTSAPVTLSSNILTRDTAVDIPSPGIPSEPPCGNSPRISRPSTAQGAPLVPPIHDPDISARTLDELRRRMEETLLDQQAKQSRRKLSTGGLSQPSREKAIRKAVASVPATPLDGPPANLGVDNLPGSSSIAKGPASATTPPSTLPPTASYPFPTTPQRNNSVRLPSASNSAGPKSAEYGGKKPSKAPGTIGMIPPPPQEISNPASLSSHFYPPNAAPVRDDPTHPTPNLYELILMLNAEPGLEAWWPNLVDILRTHYGAERASLAVPGDMTDLENVPWGQKATFNSNPVPDPVNHQPTAQGGSSQENSSKVKDRNAATTSKSPRPSSSSGRPSLLSRHSFPGFGKDRNISSKQPSFLTNDTTLHSQPEEPQPQPQPQQQQQTTTTSDQASLDEESRDPTMAVFVFPRPLETEKDPLIKRTGIVSLFERTKPTVLTREYSYNPNSPTFNPTTPNETVQTTPTPEPSQAPRQETASGGSRQSWPTSGHSETTPTNTLYHSDLRSQKNHHRRLPSDPLYEEYEQTPQSPWSQSPAPSPAPRTHPDQNPFFTNHAVDEEAFAKSPPPHDYSRMEPVAAIGIDRAKTVVHIPLLYTDSTKCSRAETVRFPIAIVSFMSPIVPYPASLRYSLTYLMPHLTTSFSLAQQYSQLERQLATDTDRPRYGRLLGLGGTFSDASSELELVAGLSGQILGEDGYLSTRGSVSSPGDISDIFKSSPVPSAAGTPGFGAPANEQVNDATAVTPTRAASIESVEEYFNLRHSRGSIVSSKPRGPKQKQNAPSLSRSKSARESDSTRPRLRDVVDSGLLESSRPPLPSRVSSQNAPSSVIAQLNREGVSLTEHVFQLMLNSIPLHLFLAKAQSGEVIWTNTKFDAYRRGHSQEPSVRDPWQNVHPNELESITKQWNKALRTGSQFTERVRVKRFNDDSAYRWFIFRANPLLSPTGQVVSWIGSFLDIHEQQVAEMQAAKEREMLATNEKFRALANSIPQVVFEATEHRGVISANEQWHLYTGQPIEEAMNFGFTKHVHRDDLEKCGVLLSSDTSDSSKALGDQINKNIDDGKIFSRGVTPALQQLVEKGVVAAQQDENGRVFYTTELRLRSKGGDYRWHLVRLVKVETSSFGDGHGSWYGTCTDINDRKLLERELNKALQKLNREMESKTKFFSNMSHEIRTPLNGILGTIPFILDTPLDSDQRRMLNTIQSSSINLRELVDNILDVSRVEAGKMNLVNSWFHVRSLLEDVIDTIISRAIDKGLEINYLMDADVPAMVYGDRFRIRQVLINLMGNAVKFTAQGEVYTRCSVLRKPGISLKPSQILLNFEVVDTGKGFSAADAQRLMQRFSQIGEDSSQHNAGSGLGLFLSKQLVEMHGGELTPSSQEGRGAKFSFYVKVDAPKPPDSAIPRPVSEAADSAVSESPKSSSHEPLTPADPSDSTVATPHVSSSSPADDSSAGISLQEQLSPPSNIEPGREKAGERDAPQPQLVQPPALLEPPSAEIPRKHDSGYSIVILCPLDHAREAIKQHIEQVVPLEVPASVTSLADVDDWKDIMYTQGARAYTHLVVNSPECDDVLETMQCLQELDADQRPRLVIISDHYQKRKINAKLEELVSSCIQVDTVPKPVKPSSFSSIFDPDNRRDLSKDRNQDMAQEVNNNFKTMSKMVKEVVGNKGHRVLLVEDDETNRMVSTSEMALNDGLF